MWVNWSYCSVKISKLLRILWDTDSEQRITYNIVNVDAHVPNHKFAIGLAMLWNFNTMFDWYTHMCLYTDSLKYVSRVNLYKFYDGETWLSKLQNWHIPRLYTIY